jgi:hypothetical protein
MLDYADDEDDKNNVDKQCKNSKKKRSRQRFSQCDKCLKSWNDIRSFELHQKVRVLTFLLERATKEVNFQFPPCKNDWRLTSHYIPASHGSFLPPRKKLTGVLHCEFSYKISDSKLNGDMMRRNLLKFYCYFSLKSDSTVLPPNCRSNSRFGVTKSLWESRITAI